jgi:hypothetical protein
MLWFYRLTWKKIIGFSGAALIIAIVPMAINVATSPTRTRSEAALIKKTQPVSTQFETPKGAPQIYLVDHFFGKAGDAVLVHGANLGGMSEKTSVSLSGQVISQDNLVTWTGDYIEFKLPTNAVSGKVAVNILGQTAEWPGTFWVVKDIGAAEIRVEKLNDTQARLMSRGINAENGLLVWLLIFQGTGTIDIQPATGVNLSSQPKTLPLGNIYELNLTYTDQGGWTTLATITKKPDQMVGIARAELSEVNLPIQSHPLYVSF